MMVAEGWMGTSVARMGWISETVVVVDHLSEGNEGVKWWWLKCVVPVALNRRRMGWISAAGEVQAAGEGERPELEATLACCSRQPGEVSILTYFDLASVLDSTLGGPKLFSLGLVSIYIMWVLRR
ncbi:hypothetical protein L1887_16787 [Cichorium endivia]|nr:hypothetical protein L1887_16787 [Cichorium endivia]